MCYKGAEFGVNRTDSDNTIPIVAQGLVSQTRFTWNSDLNENSFSCNTNTIHQIASNFGTCYDNANGTARAKFSNQHNIEKLL